MGEVLFGLNTRSNGGYVFFQLRASRKLDKQNVHNMCKPSASVGAIKFFVMMRANQATSKWQTRQLLKVQLLYGAAAQPGWLTLAIYLRQCHVLLFTIMMLIKLQQLFKLTWDRKAQHVYDMCA